MIAGERGVGRIANMSGVKSPIVMLTADGASAFQSETGVDVYALLDLMKRTPTERLRIAVANANNLKRMHEVTRRTTRTK